MQHMNVIDEKALRTEVTDPLVNRINSEVIPNLEAAVGRVVPMLEAAISRQVAGLIGGIVTAGARLLEQADTDVAGILSGLDGWTHQIEIPKITIRLTGPGQGLTPPKGIE